MKKLIIMTILQAILFGLAYADYHYAGHEGTNEYPYASWETAADSIQLAVDASSPHDTVYIGVGEWYEAAACDFYDSVAIIGMGWDSTYWHTDTYQVEAIEIGDACSLEGILFQHNDHWMPVRILGGASGTVKSCKFINSLVGATINGGNSEVINCVFDSCGKAVDILDFSGTFLISNNLILNTTGDWALMIYSSSSIIQNNIIIPGTITTIEGPNAVIFNNIIINGVYGIASSNSKKINNNLINLREDALLSYADSVINNLISDCNVGINLGDSCATIAYNAFWNVDTLIKAWGQPFDSLNNLTCNPMYESDSNFHLQAFSPLIDAGYPNILDVDFSRSDIGAYGGPYGESYEYQDLAPAIPDSIIAEYISDTLYIRWLYNTEADFSHYQLHKDTVSGFEPSVFNQIAEPETSIYIDNDVNSEHNYYYRIASVDNQYNISEFSAELAVNITGIWGRGGATLPQITSIQTNYPNPFNSSTTIIYTVANLGPIPAEIEIHIYDIVGRKVRTLVNERRDIGEHSVIWDGRNDSGGECSTGVYFARISQWGLSVSGKPRKLVLVK